MTELIKICRHTQTIEIDYLFLWKRQCGRMKLELVLKSPVCPLAALVIPCQAKTGVPNYIKPWADFSLRGWSGAEHSYK